ncbi:MAG: sigma-70 family RNA polymerase sigma factor [Planctomycetes bacterium]|nr:sigma-70 family RNA polymerase sigma factor [Planctomycetota bacterium]
MNDPADTPETMLQQGRALRALARSILRSADDADDVVQDAFATALSSGHEPQRPGWWVRVVQNLARRRLRDRARQQRRHDQHAQLGGEPSAAPDDVVAQVETHRLVADTVLQLGEPYRTALVLRFWHDLPPRAIAQRLGLPVATVKTHLQRGIAELRRRLDARRSRRDWVLALAPIAWPQLAVGAAGGTSFAACLHALWMLMNAKLIAGAVAAVVVLGLLVWQPWGAPLPAPATAAVADGATAPASSGGSGAGAAAAPMAGEVAAAGGDAPVERTAAPADERTCMVVGRIVLPGGVPASPGRVRFVDRFERQAELAAATADDGTFAVAVPRGTSWLRFTWALADAPGFAVRQLALDSDVNDRIADDRLDLGTFVLERGVAVSGRVVEADGSPLRERVRLLAWDPGYSGSWPAMAEGRTVGFVDPDGAFVLDDRWSANASGSWVLCAVGPSGVGWADLAFAAGQELLDPVQIRLLTGGGVDVRVVDSDGAPLGGVEVVAIPHFAPIGLEPMWQASYARNGLTARGEVASLLARRTDVDGRASFRNLPRRDDERVRDANRSNNLGPAMICVARKAGLVTAIADCDPAADAATMVELTLLRQRRVAVFGRVTTGDGVAVPGVRVRYNGREGEAVSDAAGRFELAATEQSRNDVWLLLEGEDVPLRHERVELPPEGDRVEHDFVVELRSPVHGRVIDQFGEPVAGVELSLGRDGGTFYSSVPERTGDDGVFAFPDAVPSHDLLWIRAPEPQTGWRPLHQQQVTQRDGEVVRLHRLPGPFVDLTLQVVDGESGAALSPSEVDLFPLHGSSRDYGVVLHPSLALGAVTAPALRIGRYRAIVRTGDGHTAMHDFELPAAAPQHTERVELWPTTSAVFTVDLGAVPAVQLAALDGETVLASLDGPGDLHSYLVDDDGKPLGHTPNTGSVHIGGKLSFRLEGVPCNAPLRLRLLGKPLCGESWFSVAPGEVAQVVVKAQPFGDVVVVGAFAARPGTLEFDLRDGGAWRAFLVRNNHGEARGEDASHHRCAVGEHRFRARLWPADGGEVVERTGTFVVRADETTTVTLD